MGDGVKVMMTVDLEGSDALFRLPLGTEVGTVFSVGPEEFFLEKRVLSFDSTRPRAMTEYGYARKLVRVPQPPKSRQMS